MTHPIVRQAARIPSHPALVGNGVVLSYAELEHLMIETARCLRNLEVQPGDRIAIAARNRPEWVIVAHAAALLGAVLVPLNTRLAAAELERSLAVFRPCLILYGREQETKLSHLHRSGLQPVPLSCLPAAVKTEKEPGLMVPGSNQPAGPAVPPDIDPDRLFAIISTSGTSGRPKGVCLTLANFLAGAEASARNLGVDPDDRWLLNLPLFHVGGLAVLFRAALHGTTIILHERFDAAQMVKAIFDEGVTHASLVATTLVRLLEYAGDRQFPDTLRAVLVGGGPVDRKLLRRARARNLPVLPTYGLTEAASQVATLPPTGVGGRADIPTAVPPLPTCRVEIRNSDGRAMPPGGKGEIWIRGPMVTRGYWNAGGDGIDTATVDGWLATGDTGFMDDSGWLTVMGRKDEMIISGGENIFPAEIEQALLRIPGIRQAVAFGVDDAHWGTVPVAVVQVASTMDFSEQAVIGALKSSLAGYKIPKRILSFQQLPLSPLGKVNRTKARAMYLESLDRSA